MDIGFYIPEVTKHVNYLPPVQIHRIFAVASSNDNCIHYNYSSFRGGQRASYQLLDVEVWSIGLTIIDIDLRIEFIDSCRTKITGITVS